MASNFLHYLDPDVSLETRLMCAVQHAGIRQEAYVKAQAFLQPIRVKDADTYEHSIRVGLLADAIAAFMHLDRKVGLFSGLLHDVGKAQTRLEVLQKAEGWTKEDAEEMMSHVMDGYRLIRGCFDFTAEVILWHHRFQPRMYPAELPNPLHDYSAGTKVMIPFYGRILSIADVFDALHRCNDKHGAEPMTGEQIKEKMFEWNRDQAFLIRDLYDARILTTEIC